MRRYPLALTLLACGLTCVHAQTEPALDYRTLMLRNSFLPGTAQLAMGQTAEGIVYLASVPLQAAGLGILVYQALAYSGRTELGWFPEEGRTYLTRFTETDPYLANPWLAFAGITLSLYGNLLSAYSQHAAHRDWVDRFGDPAGLQPVRTGRESLLRLLAAPWTPHNVLSFDTLVALSFTVGGSLSGGDFARMGAYFQRETVPFFGREVTPAQGLGLRLATAILLVTANAASEEILFRGSLLEQRGVTTSSLSFGLAHLPNAIIPGVALEDTVLQTVFALGFGFYAAQSTVARGYNYERMVALHFWNNVLAFVLGYLVDPESQSYLGIGFRAAL